jgi:hypothetical protein
VHRRVHGTGDQIRIQAQIMLLVDAEDTPGQVTRGQLGITVIIGEQNDLFQALHQTGLGEHGAAIA